MPHYSPLAGEGRNHRRGRAAIRRLVSRVAHGLPDVKGRIDHLGVDTKGNRLFVAAVDNHTLEVVDVNLGRRFTRLRKRETGSGGLGFLDCKWKEDRRHGHRCASRIVSAGKNRSRIFVKVPEKKEIQVIDAVKRSVLARWPVAEENNFPTALAEAHQRLFVAGWKPGQSVVFDRESGKQIASREIAGPSDDLFFDSERGRIYVLTSYGFIEVFRQKDPAHYASGSTPPNATAHTNRFIRYRMEKAFCSHSTTRGTERGSSCVSGALIPLPVLRPSHEVDHTKDIRVDRACP